MSNSEFIHDPIGIMVLDEPTNVRVKTGAASSTTTAKVIPYSAKHVSGEYIELWAGGDTYFVPRVANYKLINNPEEELQSIVNSPPNNSNNTSHA